MKMVATKDIHISACTSLTEPLMGTLELDENQVVEVNELVNKSFSLSSATEMFRVHFDYCLESRSMRFYLKKDFVDEYFRPFVSASIQVELCGNTSQVNNFLQKLPVDCFIDVKFSDSCFLVVYKDLGDTVL